MILSICLCDIPVSLCSIFWTASFLLSNQWNGISNLQDIEYGWVDWRFIASAKNAQAHWSTLPCASWWVHRTSLTYRYYPRYCIYFQGYRGENPVSTLFFIQGKSHRCLESTVLIQSVAYAPDSFCNSWIQCTERNTGQCDLYHTVWRTFIVSLWSLSAWKIAWISPVALIAFVNPFFVNYHYSIHRQ